MPFQKGNKLFKKRKVNKGGAPKTKDLIVARNAADVARRILERNTRPIMDSYLGFVAEDPATARHAVDKLLPEIKQDDNHRPVAIQIVIEGDHATVESKGDGRTILIGGE